MKRKHQFTLLFSLISLVACQADNNNLTQSTYDFVIDKNNISVSGVSSGGYMATQFHVSHSAKTTGVGIIAGGPFWCARNEITRALGPCMKGGNIDPNLIQDYVKSSQKNNSIDNVSHMKNDKVWIFHGKKDIIMAQSVSDAIENFYLNYMDESNISTIYDVEANHSMPTLSSGGQCDTIGQDFLNACEYDAAGEMLTAFYGKLNPRTEAIGKILSIDQSKYTEAQFTETGYLYVPSGCKDNNQCQLHTVFHGCMQSSEFINEKFIKGAGYNEWAESNNIVVFYPQIKSSRFSPMNPKGCWDWWGYTNEDYSNKNGPQIMAVDAMINHISGVK